MLLRGAEGSDLHLTDSGTGVARGSMPFDVPEPELRVGDVKQYLYCPRIIYYDYVLPVERRQTPTMKLAREEHVRLEQLESRRRLSRYRLGEGERRFRVPLHSSRFGLRGVLDALLITPVGYFPVDFKVTEHGASVGHKYQLLAYALLLEETFGVAVRAGFICLAPRGEVVEVPVTSSGRLHVRRLLGAIRNLIRREVLPEVRHSTARCCDCEFRNYCRDVEVA